MARFSGAGAVLKLVQTLMYALEFCCAGLIIGIYSYFLAVLSERDLDIPAYVKAVEGMAGVAALYTFFAVLLTCCLGGKMFFAFLAIIFDVLFAAAFIAIAVLTRDGASSCTSDVKTPIGNGPADSKTGFGNEGDRNITYSTSLGTACRFNTACFIVAIIGALLFVISALIQLFIGRNHQKEKRFGPSPANGYTSGSGVPFWRRRRARTTAARNDQMTPAVAPTLPPVADVRPSHDTAYTGSTVAPGATTATYDSHGKPVPTYGHTNTRPPYF